MLLKVSERGTNRKLVYQLLLVVYSKIRRVLTIFEIQTVLMLKTTFLHTQLEFENHAVRIWRRNLAPEN